MSIAENYPRQTGTVPAGEGFLLDYSWVQHPIHSYGVFVAPKNDRPGSMTFCCWFAVTPHKMRRRHLISVSAALYGRCFASFVSSRSLALGGLGAQPQVCFAYFCTHKSRPPPGRRTDYAFAKGSVPPKATTILAQKFFYTLSFEKSSPAGQACRLKPFIKLCDAARRLQS